jgi:hypothetical protein
VSSQLSLENRGNLYGQLQQFLHIEFYMNNKQRAEKKRALEIEKEGWVNSGACWSVLEHFGAED